MKLDDKEQEWVEMSTNGWWGTAGDNVLKRSQ